MLLFISISIHSIKPGIHDLHCMLQLFWHSLPCTWLLCCYYLQPCHTQPPGRHWRVLAMQTRTLWPWETLYCHLFPSASGGRKIMFICVPVPHKSNDSSRLQSDLHIRKRIWRRCRWRICWLLWHFFTGLKGIVCQVFINKLPRENFFIFINHKRLGQRELLKTCQN